MSVNREELKRIIDFIHEDDAAKIYDFICHLNLNQEKGSINQNDLEFISKDEKLIRQIKDSQNDRKNGRFYNREDGLEYLQDRIAGFENEYEL